MKNSFGRRIELCGLYCQRAIYAHGHVIAAILATAIVLYAKIGVCMYPTQDVVGFVFKWMGQISDVGVSQFHTVDADYSPLYLFMISLLSLIPGGEEVTVSGYTFFQNWMLALKSCYFVFDILNAIAVALIVRHITNDRYKAAVAYIVAAVLPVQFVNSAVWGNADSIYACFLLYALYFALKKKGGAAMFFFGLAFANKLQAVFLAPFIVYLIINRRIKLRKVLYAPLAVLISFVPAYICGAKFSAPFAFYTKQLGGYQKLTLGCPNFWQLFAFRSDNENIISRGAPFFGLAVIGVFFAVLLLRHIKQTDLNLLAIAAFTVGVTVFFLPHMHERYFYLLDILTVAYALTRGRRYELIAMMQFASGIAYYHYISGRYFIDRWGEDSVHIAAVTVAAVLILLFTDILKFEHDDREKVLREIDMEITKNTQ